MGHACEQFYRTWCYSGRSVNGADGWKIRAKSDGLLLQEAEGLADVANYWFPMECPSGRPPGRRLALFRRQGDSIVAHGAQVPGLVGGRGGVSFEHVLVGLPASLGALEVLKLWRSSSWRVEDADFSPRLDRFVWDGGVCGPEFQSGAGGDAGAEEERDGAIAVEFLNQPDVMPWASYVLRACLAAVEGTIDKVFLAGKDDTIVRLLFVVFYCLPERLRQKLTFSTHENPKQTRGVQIVGVTTFEGEEVDLPRFCYEGRYCALNTFTASSRENLECPVFAQSAIQWILCGQYGHIARIGKEFDALDPADAPGVRELDLLTKYLPEADDAPIAIDGLLEFCGSPALGRSRIRDAKALELLLAHATKDEAFAGSLASKLGTWLPGHKAAAAELAQGLAERGIGKLQEGLAFDALDWHGRFAGRLGREIEVEYWDGLLVKCRERAYTGVEAQVRIPSLETRLSLLGVWQQWHHLTDRGSESAFGGLVECWLRLQPQELPNLLNSRLDHELKREGVRLWLESRSSEHFRRVVEEARKSGEFQRQLVAQLADLFNVQNDVSRGFPASLAGLGLRELRAGAEFTDVAWLATFAGEVGGAMETRFWEELLAVCQGSISRADPRRGLLPALETRICLFEAWEKAIKGRGGPLPGGLVDSWLRVTPLELVLILKSRVLVGLKLEAVRLCLAGSTPLDPQAGDAIFSLICSDADLTWLLFFNLPQWLAGAGGGRIPENCLSRLLLSEDQLLGAARFCDEQVVATVELWNAYAAKLMPARMSVLLSFGQYARNPGAFEKAALPSELMKEKFWARERETRTAVTIVVDRLLSQGSLDDFEKALGWFGESKCWASSAADLVELAYGRLVGVTVDCQDALLQRLLVVFGAILQEARRSGGVAAASSAPEELREGDYEPLLRIAARYLPGSSLLRSPTGQRVIELLGAQDQFAESQQQWLTNLRALLEVRRATQFDPKMIEPLATSYLALDKAADADMRAEVNVLLFKLIFKEPKLLKAALEAFVNNVYARNEGLFMRGFMPGFLEELIRLERLSESAVVAEVFVKFCIEGCSLEGEGGGNFADRRSSEMRKWLRRFKDGLTAKSLRRLNRRARRWNENTRERWYGEIGYEESWFRTRTGKRVLVYGSLLVVLVGVLIVLGGATSSGRRKAAPDKTKALVGGNKPPQGQSVAQKEATNAPPVQGKKSPIESAGNGATTNPPPKPSMGWLSITVTPRLRNTYFYLDGVGFEPVAGMSVTVGAHVLNVSNADYYPWGQTVQVSAGRASDCKVNLEARPARLELEVTNVDAVVCQLHDGALQPVALTNRLAMLPPGTNSLFISAPGYTTQQLVIVMSPNKTYSPTVQIKELGREEFDKAKEDFETLTNSTLWLLQIYGGEEWRKFQKNIQEVKDLKVAARQYGEAYAYWKKKLNDSEIQKRKMEEQESREKIEQLFHSRTGSDEDWKRRVNTEIKPWVDTYQEQFGEGPPFTNRAGDVITQLQEWRRRIALNGSR